MILSGHSPKNESAIYDRLRDAENLDEVDKAITRYVLNPMYSYEVEVVYKDAAKIYGNTESLTLYRGLNFDTKEDYDKFIKSIKNGTLVTKSISSWSSNKKEAETFSVTKPSYMEFMDAARMKMISDQKTKGERITGYRGLILKTRISKGKGLDLRKFENHAESEVLLPAGNYKVTYEDVLSYQDIMKTTTPDEQIMKLTKKSSNESKKILDYIFKNYKPNQLSEEARHKLYLITAPTEFHSTVSVQDPNKYTFEKHRVIRAVMTTFNPDLVPYYLDSDVVKLKANMKKEYKKVIKEVFSNYEDGATIDWFYNHNYFARFCGVEIDLAKAERSTLGKAYQKQDQIVKDINKIKDPKDKSQAIDDELERIRKIISSM